MIKNIVEELQNIIYSFIEQTLIELNTYYVPANFIALRT